MKPKFSQKGFEYRFFNCKNKFLIAFLLYSGMYFKAYSYISGNPITNNLSIVQVMYGYYNTAVIIYTNNVVEVTGTVWMGDDKKIVVQKWQC